jgi:hypothetical protein
MCRQPARPDWPASRMLRPSGRSRHVDSAAFISGADWPRTSRLASAFSLWLHIRGEFIEAATPQKTSLHVPQPSRNICWRETRWRSLIGARYHPSGGTARACGRAARAALAQFRHRYSATFSVRSREIGIFTCEKSTTYVLGPSRMEASRAADGNLSFGLSQ